MTAAETLAVKHQQQRALEDFFKARALAQNVHATLQEALTVGAEMMNYNINPDLFPEGSDGRALIEELMALFGAAQAFYGHLRTNHAELLDWRPE